MTHVSFLESSFAMMMFMLWRLLGSTVFEGVFPPKPLTKALLVRNLAGLGLESDFFLPPKRLVPKVTKLSFLAARPRIRDLILFLSCFALDMSGA